MLLLCVMGDSIMSGKSVESQVDRSRFVFLIREMRKVLIQEDYCEH